MAAISLIIGLILGAPLGWVLFICLEDLYQRQVNKPPTKDEWRVM